MLTPAEAVALSPKVAKLAEELRAALSPDGDGAKKITRAEGRRIVRLALSLAAEIVLDILD